MRLSFHGGAGTVTGSRFLLEVGSYHYLVDCGLFQGLKELRALNWRRPAFDPGIVDYLILTHTHIDHAGYLPRFVSEGYRGPILCTPATLELADILLRDSAKIQEEDAAYANKKGYSKHTKALPLYTSREVTRAMKQFRSVPYGKWQQPTSELRFRFIDAGHILGSAMVQCEIRERQGAPYRIVFSGDLGRYNMPLHPDPQPLPECDALVIESTYGNRTHDALSFEDQILDAFTHTFAAQGVVLIPSFAVGRAQQVTLILRRMMERGELPEVPIHIDSPMAVDATRIYNKYCADHRLDTCKTSKGESLLFPRNVHFHRTIAESKQLNALSGPRVIISGSGMMTGGRILHHMEQRVTRPENLLCLVGYQAPGTRGARLLQGAQTVRIHGLDIPVRARFMSLHGLSGHADRNELLHWVRTAPKPPKAIFVVHGELEAATDLAAALRRELGSATFVPALDDEYALDPIRGPQPLPRPAGEPILPAVPVEGRAPDAAAPGRPLPVAAAPAMTVVTPAQVSTMGGDGRARGGRARRAAPATVPSAHRPARQVPLPAEIPQLPPEDPEAAERVRRIIESPAYARSDQDLALLAADSLGPVRLLLDYLKPEILLEEHKVESTIVVFGGTRIVEPQVAQERLRALRARLAGEKGNRELEQRIAVAKRVAAKSAYYEEARRFGKLVSERGQQGGAGRLVIVTGGGPGIMEASNRGAFEAGAKSIGLSISLPMEQFPNPYVTPGLCFSFRYFALRKMHFLRRAKAMVAFPGGYGTLDELFEALALIQTRAIDAMPVVLVGKKFWRAAFDAAFLADEGVIDREDIDLFSFAETAQEAWEHIGRWYEKRGQDLMAPSSDNHA